MRLLTKIPRNESAGKAIRMALHNCMVVHVESDDGLVGEEFWLAQAHQVGDLVVMDEDKASGEKTGRFWIDIKYDPAFPSHFVHANVRQPLHTDGSYESKAPNISFFYCIREADIGGATTFVSVETVKRCLALEEPALLEMLESTPVTHGKGGDSKTMPVFYENNRVNWNYFRAEKSEMTERFHNYLESRIINMGIVEGVRLKPGEALFFRDDLILHGRNAYIGQRWLRKGGITWTG